MVMYVNKEGKYVLSYVKLQVFNVTPYVLIQNSNYGCIPCINI